MICLQETKCESFDWKFIQKFCPKRFHQFAYAPSVGASGGILIIWNSSIFEGALLEVHSYAISINFTSRHNNENWNLISVYGPCHGALRDSFVS